MQVGQTRMRPMSGNACCAQSLIATPEPGGTAITSTEIAYTPSLSSVE